MSDQIDFRLRYQVKADTPHGILFNFLRSKNEGYPARQMALWSLSAYWYPLACQWTGRFEEDRLQAIARLSISDLRQQIKYLACSFGLEQELAESGSPYGMEHSPGGGIPAVPVQQIPAAAQSNGFGGKEEDSESSPGFPELLHGNPEDDALLDKI